MDSIDAFIEWMRAVMRGSNEDPHKAPGAAQPHPGGQRPRDLPGIRFEPPRPPGKGSRWYRSLVERHTTRALPNGPVCPTCGKRHMGRCAAKK
jgi:hypothetical protein